MTTALFLGRFQPLHNGHLSVIESLAATHERVIIAIGSAQEAHTARNPFTVGERYRMVRDSLLALRSARRVDNVDICAVPDTPRDEDWVAEVEKWCPPFQVVVATNENVERLFRKDLRYGLVYPEMFSREEYSSTKVRAYMRDLGTGEALVPSPVWRILQEIDGVQRVRRLETSGNGW